MATPPPPAPLPDPAVVVLVGVAGAGKSFWAAERYRPAEVVSSDALRAVVGSGPADLDASRDAFALLEQIVAARIGRRLTTVVDTLGLDGERRRAYLAQARAAGLPAVAVVFETPPALCRTRNADRDRPVPAGVLAAQLRKLTEIQEALAEEGWDHVLRVEQVDQAAAPPAREAAAPVEPERPTGLQVILQVSRFAWGDEPGPWLRDLARTAADVGFAGLALMDHLIQIPQVGRPWEPLPEPYVTLGFLAGQAIGLRLGTLVSPVTFRAPGVLAKTVATLDVLSGGRAFCGLGAGWWAREHAAYGLPFPAPGQRLDQLQSCIETLRALWSAGTKEFTGTYASLPETTCYPRPASSIPILVGGSGERRTLRIVAEQADGCNLPSDVQRLPGRLEVLHRHCRDVGRDPADLEVTVLDVPVIGRDREDTARRVERLRGRTSAATYAARHHAGLAADHAARYRELADLGVSTVFCSLPDLTGADDLERCRPVILAARA
jgi:alkanesulfonate monooxygenase SsuD/methylene tetrahydromethanopterin reductase-like flavin-dependent oxidoreductase (luciferase family)/predicted kinase